MSWRTVVISNRCKLDYRMGYMVVRGEETKRIFLEEIALVLIENPAIALTGCLLEELIRQKVRVIFCDSKHSPMAELAPYYGAHDCSRKLKAQVGWSDAIKSAVWTQIVTEKIKMQATLLEELGKEREALLLNTYAEQVELNDTTNREGHAAKVYFNALFGMSFTRDDGTPANAALDYGYSLLLSAFNREITANGYLTQWGLCHDNQFNHFNLSCDLMEPFRILVDRAVQKAAWPLFSTEEKHCLASVLHETVEIAKTKQTVLNAIKIYVRSVLEALNEGDPSRLQFYQLL